MTLGPKLVQKNQNELSLEWDALASVRHRQIVSRVDRTYHEVLVPTVLSLCSTQAENGTVLDVGCGTGELSALLASRARRVVGVDPSPRSIELARQGSLAPTGRLEFRCETIEEFALVSYERFDLVVANMVLMDCLNLDGVLTAISSVLVPGGLFVCTITHPWHWPKYWGYAEAIWFDYNQELEIEAPFRISSEVTDVVSTHIHRPLGRYIGAMARGKFIVSDVLEPMPGEASSAPSWEYPRYLAISAVRQAV